MPPLPQPPPPPPTEEQTEAAFYDLMRANNVSTDCGNCHKQGGNSPKLVGTDAEILAAIKDVTSTQNRDLSYVTPGKPSESYLYLKVIGSGAGRRMPPDDGYSPQSDEAKLIERFINELEP